jgi:tyrosinase
VTINNGTTTNDTSANQTRAPPPPAPTNEYGYGTKHYRRDAAPADFFAVTGPKANGSVPLRKEIRELQKDTTMWTLYILALDMLQYTNQSDMLSWYQIGGIHGEPFVPWDNVQSVPGNDQNGYCPHSSIIFPTWHRPYLALFEVSSPLVPFLTTVR